MHSRGFLGLEGGFLHFSFDVFRAFDSGFCSMNRYTWYSFGMFQLLGPGLRWALRFSSCLPPPPPQCRVGLGNRATHLWPKTNGFSMLFSFSFCRSPPTRSRGGNLGKLAAHAVAQDCLASFVFNFSRFHRHILDPPRPVAVVVCRWLSLCRIVSCPLRLRRPPLFLCFYWRSSVGFVALAFRSAGVVFEESHLRLVRVLVRGIGVSMNFPYLMNIRVVRVG